MYVICLNAINLRNVISLMYYHLCKSCIKLIVFILRYFIYFLYKFTYFFTVCVNTSVSNYRKTDWIALSMIIVIIPEYAT